LFSADRFFLAGARNSSAVIVAERRGLEGRQTIVVSVLRPGASEFSVPQAIAEGNVSEATVAVDGNGDAAIAWSSIEGVDREHINLAVLSRDGVLGPTQVVGSGRSVPVPPDEEHPDVEYARVLGSPAVALGDDLSVTLAWVNCAVAPRKYGREGCPIDYRTRRAKAPFSPLYRVNGHAAADVSLVASPSRTTLMTWRAGTPPQWHEVMAATARVGAQVSRPRPLGATTDQTDPVFAVNGRGGGAAAWLDRFEQETIGALLSRGRFRPPTRFHPVGDRYASTQVRPAVGVDDAGRAIALFVSDRCNLRHGRCHFARSLRAVFGRAS
jgi:hypothetical protein